MSILHEHHSGQSIPTVNPLPKYPHLTTRELVLCLLAVHSRGHSASSVDQVRAEILRRETEAGDER